MELKEQLPQSGELNKHVQYLEQWRLSIHKHRQLFPCSAVLNECCLTFKRSWIPLWICEGCEPFAWWAMYQNVFCIQFRECLVQCLQWKTEAQNMTRNCLKSLNEEAAKARIQTAQVSSGVLFSTYILNADIVTWSQRLGVHCWSSTYFFCKALGEFLNILVSFSVEEG